MSEFQPVKSASNNHKGYRLEDDGSLTIQFANGGIYNYPELESTDRDEYIRRAPTDESNGKFFNERIRMTKFNKLDK